MVPDIEWGKRIRLVLDIGCTDSGFAAALLNKDVLTLTLGLKDDLVDLAQVALERGFPAVVSPFGNRRLPFPSSVFDAIHCGECHTHWHSNGLCSLIMLLAIELLSLNPISRRSIFSTFSGGKLLLEMNRVLRPSGYFILSTLHDSIEVEEGLAIYVVRMLIIGF